MGDRVLELRPIEDTDFMMMDEWFHKPYILKWYEDPEAWLNEIRQRAGAYAFIRHFIVMEGNQPMGFCQYYNCFDAGEDWYAITTPQETYSIDYLIGEEAYLKQGFGKQIVQLLTQMIGRSTQAKRIIVQPEEGNLASCKALLSCGYRYDPDLKYYCMDL